MKTIEVGTFEAKNRLSELLSKAARGQRILITRRGRGVAMLCAPESAGGDAGLHSSRELMNRLRAFRKNAGTGAESLF